MTLEARDQSWIQLEMEMTLEAREQSWIQLEMAPRTRAELARTPGEQGEKTKVFGSQEESSS